MLNLLTHLDRLLRGETTRPESLREGRIDVASGGMATMIVLLGMIYGLCMGSYSLLKEQPAALVDSVPRYLPLFATTVKVPALFYLTLVVTFPSLYVFNALVGSRLSLTNVLRLLVASLAVNLAVLASLGPIVLFFSVSTKSYSFILLLNVVAFSVAGVLGLVFLLQTLHRMTAPAWPEIVRKDAERPREPSPDVGSSPLYPSDTGIELAPGERIADEPSALDMPEGQTLARHTRLVFGCWVVVFAIVGAQMGWVLRPFVGSPNLPFSWLRARQSNFFEAVLDSIRALLTTGG
jgi:hypothetical protein